MTTSPNRLGAAAPRRDTDRRSPPCGKASGNFGDYSIAHCSRSRPLYRQQIWTEGRCLREGASHQVTAQKPSPSSWELQRCAARLC